MRCEKLTKELRQRSDLHASRLELCKGSEGARIDARNDFAEKGGGKEYAIDSHLQLRGEVSGDGFAGG
jgi:hypothetical protein